MIVESISGGTVSVEVLDDNPIVTISTQAPTITGTADHAQLDNLDFVNSGHTGFEQAGAGDAAVEAHEIAYNHDHYDTAYGWGDHAAAGYEVKSDKGQNNGYAPLDAGGKVPIENLPSTLLVYKGVWDAFSNNPDLKPVDLEKKGWVYNVSVAGEQFGIVWKLGDWAIYNDSGVLEKSDNSDDVVSVNGQQGVVVLDAEDVGASPDTHLHAGQVITPDGVAFDTVTPYVVQNPAEMGWNAVDGTIDLRLLNSTTLQIGQELHIYGKASEAILNGDICQFAGVQGDHILIKKAVQSEIAVNPYLIVGIATQNINSSDFGYITWFGKINGVYTTGLALADLLYFDSSGVTAGAWTKTPPAAPYRKILMAAVIKLATGGAENGIIIVRPTFGTKFADLDDVDGTDTTIADTDTLPKKDTSGLIKFVSWSNIKTLLSGIYAKLSGGNTFSGVQSMLDGIKATKIYPSVDSTNAIGIYKADGTTPIGVIDSTNGRFLWGYATQQSASYQFQINGALWAGGAIRSLGSISYGTASSYCNINGNSTLSIFSHLGAARFDFTNSNGTFFNILADGGLNQTNGKYFYQAASPTADTVNDIRTRNNAGVYTFELCTVANATKGGGTWVEKFRIDTNGFQAAQYDDVLPNGNWEPAGGGAAPDVVTHTIAGLATNFRCFDGGTTEEKMSNVFEILHGIDIDSLNAGTLKAEIHAHFLPATTGSGVVKCFYDLVYLPVNGAPIAWGTFSNLVTVNANEQYYHKLGGVELTKPSSGFGIGDQVIVNFRRTPADAEDTYAGDILFQQCALHMPFNSTGSRQRYTK